MRTANGFRSQSYLSSPSCLSYCQLKCKVGINNNFTTYLRDSLVNLTTLFDAAYCEENIAEKACYFRESVHISPFFLVVELSFAVSPLTEVLRCWARKSNSLPVTCHTGLPNSSFRRCTHALSIAVRTLWCSAIAYFCRICRSWLSAAWILVLLRGF